MSRLFGAIRLLPRGQPDPIAQKPERIQPLRPYGEPVALLVRREWQPHTRSPPVGTAVRSSAGSLLVAIAVVACGGLLVFLNSPQRPPRPTEPEKANSPVDADLTRSLLQIHPGIPLERVEQQLDSFRHEPQTLDASQGYPVIRIKYEGFLQAPVPHLSHPPMPFVPGPHTVVLEFDGRIPHHPLIRARITAQRPGEQASE